MASVLKDTRTFYQTAVVGRINTCPRVASVPAVHNDARRCVIGGARETLPPGLRAGAREATRELRRLPLPRSGRGPAGRKRVLTSPPTSLQRRRVQRMCRVITFFEIASEYI